MSKFKRPNHKSNENFISKQKKQLLNKADDGVKFSYKYLDIDHEKFCLNSKETPYFLKVLNRLKDLCQMPCLHLKTAYSKTLRNHYIEWKDVSESCFGIPNEEEIVDKPFQFSISQGEHGRVIGFFIENVFYIVWFDHNHSLYK